MRISERQQSAESKEGEARQHVPLRDGDVVHFPQHADESGRRAPGLLEFLQCLGRNRRRRHRGRGRHDVVYRSVAR